MSDERKDLEKALDRLLSGREIHVGMQDALQALDWSMSGTRPSGAPHSIFQLVQHMNYWQEWAVRWLDAEDPPVPEHASESWPDDAAPQSEDEWQRAVDRLQSGQQQLQERSRQADLLARQGQQSRLEMLQAIAAHNSHHLGQVVLLRQMLGSWPPPYGGLTW